jgi:hypothetical protein
MGRALEAEARPGLTLDPRLADVFGDEKSLPQLLSLFQVFNSYLLSADYTAPQA